MRRPGFLANVDTPKPSAEEKKAQEAAIMKCSQGDPNEDGVVNILDIQLCINRALKPEEFPTPAPKPAKTPKSSGRCDSPDIAERNRSHREWITANPCHGVHQQVACKNGKWICEPCKRPPDWSKSWCWDPRPGKNLVSECIDGKLVCKDLSTKPSGIATDLISKIKGPPAGVPTEYLIGAAILAAILLLRK